MIIIQSPPIYRPTSTAVTSIITPLHLTYQHLSPFASGSNLLPKQPLNRPASYLLALNLTIPLQHLDELAFRKGFDGDLATAASTYVGLEMLGELGGGEDVCGDAHDVCGWGTVRRNAFVALVSLGSRGNVIFGFLLW